MGLMFDTMIAFFADDNWPYDQLEEMPAIRTGFSGENGKWMCFAHVREELEQFVFYSVLPVNAPPPRRAAVAEFITRANSGMIIGNFEMDYSDGEVRYKTSVDVEGSDLTLPLVRQLVYANVSTVDHYLPGLMSVLYTDIPPADAIAKIEGDDLLD
ncbi:MAG: YbjN domain-containing protein [Anaerolineae bacterium]|nr:YbjN domain-containing protein [Anaerolineae bacterium]